MKLLRCHALLGLFVIAGGSAATPPVRSPADLSGDWHLLVDDSILAEKRGVTRRYHAFAKDPRNPVLVADRPWEGKVAYVYGSALPGEDGRGYRLWYHAWQGGEYRNLYATSPDGVRWDKPALGLVEFQGSKDNNLLFRRTKEDHLPVVLWTPDDPDPARRYKLINYDYGRTKPANLVSGFWGATSADGIHWRDLPRNPVLADLGDVGNFVWDARARHYVGYPKVFAPVRGFRRRAVGYTATAQFEQWPPAELILVPDRIDDRWVTQDKQHTDFYGLCAFPYESGHIGLLWVFRITDGNNDGPIFVELVSSRDGVKWHRQEGDRPPLLDVGAAGAWDGGMITTVNQPLVEGDRIKLFYGGARHTHGGTKNAESAIGVATLRKDGFASLDAPAATPGVVTTRRWRGGGGPLRVNGDFRGGALRAEVLEAGGRVVPGYEMEECVAVTADGVDLPLRWRERSTLPDSARGRQLRFQVAGGSLYSFHVGPGVIWEEPAAAPDLAIDFEGTPGPARVALVGGAKVQAGEGGNRALVLKKAGDAADLPGTAELGRAFTLAARVRTGSTSWARIFSAHRGTGEPATGELIFDFNPRSGVVRLVVNGQRVQSRPRYLGDKQSHHYAATYADGEVVLYVDGARVGEGRIRQGSAHLFSDRSIIEHLGAGRPLTGINLAGDLRVGEDPGTRFITFRDEAANLPTEQLVGTVDDLLVALRALGEAEVEREARPR
jgi:hypothetical protein